MPSIALSPRVEVTLSADARRAVLATCVDGAAMRFQLDAQPPRLKVGVLLAQRDRPVDVSTRPAVVTAALGPAASPSRQDDEDAVGGWLTTFCEQAGLWAADDGGLARGLTGASFPLVARLYGLGATTLDEVPGWAAPVLSEEHPRAAAGALLGSTVSRSVVAALAGSLVPGGGPPTPPHLIPMALALMGAPVLPPDAVVRVLRAATPALPCPSSGLPTIDDIARVRRLAAGLGAQRAERLLMDAATIGDGPRVLVRTAVLLEGMPSGACLRLPRRLTALHDRCVELTPVDPRPRASIPLPRPEPRPVPRARPRPAPLPRQQLVAPRIRGAAPRPVDAFTYTAQATRLHRRAIGFHLRLVLPRSVPELRAWGHQHHSCVGSFGAAVASGESLIVGVERDDVLTYCVEVTPGSRVIRQFHGPYNRPVPPSTAGAVCAVLLAEGLLDPRHPANMPWLQVSRAVPSS